MAFIVDFPISTSAAKEYVAGLITASSAALKNENWSIAEELTEQLGQALIMVAARSPGAFASGASEVSGCEEVGAQIFGITEAISGLLGNGGEWAMAQAEGLVRAAGLAGRDAAKRDPDGFIALCESIIDSNPWT